jgi:hypothetical protein
MRNVIPYDEYCDIYSVLGMPKNEDFGFKSMVFSLQSQTVTTGMLSMVFHAHHLR